MQCRESRTSHNLFKLQHLYYQHHQYNLYVHATQYQSKIQVRPSVHGYVGPVEYPFASQSPV
jgi:hypothetical protein